MFFNSPISYAARSMINPVSGTHGISNGGGSNPPCPTCVDNITDLELQSLDKIEQFYTSNLAGKTYADIPTDFVQYLKLYNIVNLAYHKYKTNRALSLLFQITSEGLTGAMNAYGLNTQNMELTIQNQWYQDQLQQIINGINVEKAFDQNTGTLHMSQTFQLAPLFKYYIQFYGMPAPGVGFDPVKLNVVLAALDKLGIDPYA